MSLLALVQGSGEAFDRAAKYVHQKGSFSSGDLNHDSIKPLMDETYKVLSNAVNAGIKTEIPDVMMNKLQNDIFLFSGMKTYSQLKEASSLLLDQNKNIKNLEQFKNDILKIDETYNQNYLRAEHQYAIAASQEAARYNEFMQDADRYNLQIRTAGDDRVRPAHAALEGITRPADDAFWNTHWPPFDWGCRCTVIQVLKDKYDVTNASTARSEAEKATSEIFRFNPGKQGIIFPKKHPYYPQHCNGDKLDVSGLIGFAQWLLDAESDKCRAKKIMDTLAKIKFKIVEENKKGAQSRKDTRSAWNKKIQPGAEYKFTAHADHADAFTLTRTTIKTLTSKFHNNVSERNQLILDLEKNTHNLKYIGWAEDESINGIQKHPDTELWQYYKIMIGGKQSFLTVKKTKDGLYKPYSVETNTEFKKIRNVKNEKPPR